MHSLGFPLAAQPFDLELLFGARDERFPLEALADFARLGAWLLSPFDPMRIEWAAKTAVARAVRDTFKGYNQDVASDSEVERYLAEVRDAHFSLETVTFALLRMPGLDHWGDEHDQLSARADVATVVASTLLKLDSHAKDGLPKASMNRAIQQAAFPGEFSDGVSAQTAKEIWKELGPSTPFLLAERWLTHPDLEPDIVADLKRLVFLSPDDRTFFQFYQLMRDTGLLQAIIGHALHIQTRLQELIARIGAAPVEFIEFPPAVVALPMDIPGLTPDELRQAAEYRSER